MGKKLLRLVVILVLVLIAALAVAWAAIDPLAKAGVEKGATYALGVPTSLKDISISLLNGQMEMDGLKIANPEGFKTPHLMDSGRFELALRPASLVSETVELKRFELDGLDVNVEQGKSGSNVSAVLNNLKKLSSKDKPEQKKEEGGKKVSVDRIVIRNVAAHVSLLPGGGESFTIQLPPIELNGVTSDSPQGVPVSELSGRILTAVVAAIVKQAGNRLPQLLSDDLGKGLQGATAALGQGAEGLVSQAQTSIGQALGKEGQAATQKAGEALKSLFGEKKDK
ncbi:MAG TPA: AsmA family protein [Phycisphaerae bacterium]|nr:AsmA family protein [Phycisphaerae bacterium]